MKRKTAIVTGQHTFPFSFRFVQEQENKESIVNRKGKKGGCPWIPRMSVSSLTVGSYWNFFIQLRVVNLQLKELTSSKESGHPVSWASDFLVSFSARQQF